MRNNNTGSILGPLLFILYVNDYPKCLTYSHATIYTDGTSQDVSDKSIDTIEYKLKDNLVNYMQWMKRNKLTIIFFLNIVYIGWGKSKVC